MEVAQRTIEEKSLKNFEKLVKIVGKMGEAKDQKYQYICRVMEKVLGSLHRPEFFLVVAQTVQIQKVFPPNELFDICVNILDQMLLSKKTSNFNSQLQEILTYRQQLTRVNRVKEPIKLMGLLNMFVEFMVYGYPNDSRR